MKPDVLMVESDVAAFAIADRRLRDRFHLVWAPTFEAARTALGRFAFDAMLTRADDDSCFGFITQVSMAHPELPVIAVAPWEVQGDRACACGAKEWVSSPVNYTRLRAVLDHSIERERPVPMSARLAVAPA
ncbi:MAG: hypothetical protein JNJ54_20365 [Myxococcaceae bacterium]|nr:hypothetical protein [Myxococcaceae bacterium]